MTPGPWFSLCPLSSSLEGEEKVLGRPRQEDRKSKGGGRCWVESGVVGVDGTLR